MPHPPLARELSTDISTWSPLSEKELIATSCQLTAETSEQWLVSADFADAQKVLVAVRARRPDLFEGLAANGGVGPDLFEGLVAKGGLPAAGPCPPDVSEDAANTFLQTRLSRVMSSDAEALAKELPQVQLSAAVYFCIESEEVMVIDVARLGNQDGHSEVHYTTKDATAHSGRRYEKVAGKVVFEPGETQKEIRVPLLDTADWEPTTEFVVWLLEDPPPIGCTLGRYLYKARVKVIDDGCFPTPRFTQQLRDGMISKVPKWTLLYDYICLNFRNPVVRRGTIKMIVLDELHSAYLLLNLLMRVYLVDRVITQGSDEETLFELLGIAGFIIVPFGILHVLEWLRLTWKVGGGSRTMLQKALLRKFFNYNETSRRELDRGDIVMAMTRDVVSLVHDGYINAIALIKSVSQIVAILLFQMLAPALFDKPYSQVYVPFVVFCIFPFFLIGFLLLRREMTTRTFSEKNRKQNALVAQVDRSVTNYRMVADYNRRPFFVSRFEAIIKEYNGAEVNANKVLKNNIYFAPWLTSIAVASYTVYGGLQAHHKDIGVGMFLANISIIKAIGSSMGSIYSILLQMQGTFPALEMITKLLNMPVDLPQRMETNRFRRLKTTETTQSTLDIAEDIDIGLPIDRLKITVMNVNFHYTVASSRTSVCEAVSCSGTIEVRQGHLVTLLGPEGEGKSTLLRIFGGVILPKPGTLFIPSHLRVLHISAEPLFFWGSLFENVTFGVKCEEDGQMTRVMDICSQLKIQKSVLAQIEEGEDGEPQVWDEVLSFTQRCLLCLARAFVANPELMCIHKPTMPFDETHSIVIFQMLCDFCQKKGVGMTEQTRHKRRPRTCIATSSKSLGVEKSDQVYVVSSRDGIKLVDKDQAKNDMLR